MSKLQTIVTCEDGTVTFMRNDNAIVRRCISWLSRMRLDKLITKYKTRIDYVEDEFIPRLSIDVTKRRS